MQVELRIRHSPRSNQLRADVERRLRFALSRFGSRVGRVVVRMDGLKGVPGAGDTSCHIEARLVPFGTVTVKERGTNLLVAIDRATGRIEL